MTLHYRGDKYLMFKYYDLDSCLSHFNIGEDECQRLAWFNILGLVVNFPITVGHWGP